MSAPIAKDADLRCPTILEWTKRQKCAFCPAFGQSDAHHYPPVGMGGRHRDDTRVVPACRLCHERCAGIPVVLDGVRLAPILVATQERAALENLRAFIDQAGPIELELLHQALIARAAARGFGPIPF